MLLSAKKLETTIWESYTVQHYHSNLSIGAIFTIYSRQNHVHIDAVYYIIFPDLQALLMFHFLIIFEMLSSHIIYMFYLLLPQVQVKIKILRKSNLIYRYPIL